MSAGVIVLVLIEYEILAVLLNGIVSEMHVEVIEIPSLGPDIFLRGKSRETLLVHENS